MRSIIADLSSILQTVILNNTIQEYVLSLLVFLVLFLAFAISKRLLIHYLGRMADKTTTDFDDFIVQLISQIGWPIMTVISLYVATAPLNLSKMTHKLVQYLVIFFVTIRVILLLQAIVQYSINKVLSKRMGGDNPSFKSMANTVTGIVKWGMWILGGVFILSNLGINVSSLVAGIGIGGIAVAMASQTVLGDAFSAMSIYMDKPFEVGDFIIIDSSMGTVEHIGIKTTRIRSLSGEQLVFSNSDLTKSRIRNYKRMQTRRIVFKIGVIYQTSLDKVQKIPSIITGILKNQEVRVERVHFQSLGDSALVYEIAYHVLSSDYNVYMDKQQAINLEIMRSFEEKGIQFAYPTQTLYVNKI